jgi:hypothetical protein
MRSALTRILRVLEQSLPELAYLSCVVPPAGSMVVQGMGPQPFAAPELDAQLREILEFVALQERRLGPGGRPAGRPINRS